jgi:hypothetical protein
MRHTRAVVLAALAVPSATVLGACAEDGNGSGPGSCVGAKCDTLGDSVEDVLEGRRDPIARTLLALAGGDAPVARASFAEEKDIRRLDDPGLAATLSLDVGASADFPPGLSAFVTMVQGVAETQCGNRNAIHTYVISDDLITRSDPFPRVVATTCATDVRQASNAFFALSFGDADGDLDGREIEAFGWDSGSRRYEFYRTVPLLDSDEGVLVITNPLDIEGELGGCQTCHRGPDDLADSVKDQIPLHPIMNELVEPWSHWHAGGFVSQRFVVPNEDAMTKYKALTSESGWLRGADSLENAIRAGYDQVVRQQRRNQLRNPANVDAALGLLRPLFCEEQLNFASEKGTSGDLHLGAVLDEGIRRLYTAVDASAFSWAWATGTSASVRISPASSQADTVELVPMRGQSAIAYEEALVTSLGARFTPQELLAIRAIDWQTPVFSDARCAMWNDVAEGVGSVEGANIGDQMRALYEQMLVLPDGTPIEAGGDRLLVIDRATPAVLEALSEDLADGNVPVVECQKDAACDLSACDEAGYCEMNLWAFGTRIDGYVRDFQSGEGRERLRAARAERLCRIDERVFPNHPAMPSDFSCP